MWLLVRAGMKTIANRYLPAEEFKLYPCYNKHDERCGCYQPYAKNKAPTQGSHHSVPGTHKRATRAAAEPTRRSKRGRRAVQYTELSDDSTGSVTATETGDDEAASRSRAQCKVPQCSAHGQKPKQGHDRVVEAVKSKMSSDCIVVIEYPVKLDAEGGKERLHASAPRRGQQKTKSAGQYAAGRCHRVDIVMAKQLHDGSVQALAGWEVQGAEHSNSRAIRNDATKAKLAGFHVEPVHADAERWECNMLVDVAFNQM